MNRRRRTLVSVGLAVSTGVALLATAGGAAADDSGEEPVLRIVTTQSTSTDTGCSYRDAFGEDADTAHGGGSRAGADSL